MTSTSENGINLIKQFEGFAPEPYLCPAGKLTVGYGHIVKQNEKKSYESRVLTEKECTVLLKRDILRYEKAVDKYITVMITQNQFDALVSFTYNLGTGALKRSTLRRKLNLGEFAGIPNEIQRWNKCNGKPLAGLTRRREAEAKLFNS